MTPLTNGSGGAAQVLANLASFHRGVGPAVVSHYDATAGASTSTARCRTPISGSSPTQVNKIIAATQGTTCRRARMSWCAARCRP